MSVFGVILVRISRIWTEYEEIQSMSPYSVRNGKMRTRITSNTDAFHAVYLLPKSYEKEVAVSGNQVFRKKYLCEKVAASITASIAALIRSLF